MDVTRIIMDQNEIRVIVSRNFEMVSYVKEYHVYKTLWNPLIGEFLSREREPDDPMDKYAVSVKKENKIVGHLPLGKSGKFPKTIFYFLRSDELSSCKIVITGKPVNLGDGEGIQVPMQVNIHWNRKVHRYTETALNNEIYTKYKILTFFSIALTTHLKL